MKQIFTLLMLVAITGSLTAQVTIDREDFPLQAGSIDTFYISNLDNPVDFPTLGADQVWDYSILEGIQEEIRVNTDVTGNTDYPGAINSYPTTFLFQIFLINVIGYEAINDDFYFEVGHTQLESAYSITPFTAGPNDTLRFVNEQIQYEGQINRLEFPVAFQNQWTSSQKDYFPFELTVAGFGLNNAPGRQSREETQIRQVAGYGDLIIPDRDGNPSTPLQVLLLKVDVTRVDSTFLQGQPAPPSLMAAFGLEQGMVTERTFYVFYMPGYGNPAADIGESGRFLHRPQAIDTMTGLNDVFTLEGKAFPNPIAAGQDLNFQLETPFGDGLCRITDLTGKTVFETSVSAGGQHNFAVKMPVHLPTGLYMYQLETDGGELMRPRIISISQ